MATQTDPAGNVTSYAYDPNGHLLTTTLQNYTGDPVGSQAGRRPCIEDSRAYDPAGRLASVTDAMGRVTSYTYTDDGLTATVTRTGPGGGSYVAGGRHLRRRPGTSSPRSPTTAPPPPTTPWTPPDRVTSQTVDPSGLDRVTAYTYTPDDHVATQAVSQGSGSPIQSTSYTYDPMGNTTSQTVSDPGAERPGRLVAADPDLRHHRDGRLRHREHWRRRRRGSPGPAAGRELPGQAGQQITTSGPVLDTTGSFTVSAWVNLAGSTGNDQSVVAQDGDRSSGFYLGFDSGTGNWKFTRPEQDENSPPDWATADSGARPRPAPGRS